MVGSGRTHELKGAAIVTTGKVVGFQEGIIDMTGPGATYTPFSRTMTLVVRVESSNAFISNGNANQMIDPPVIKKVIGHPVFADMIAGGFDG